jgi:hypothetical protein
VKRTLIETAVVLGVCVAAVFSLEGGASMLLFARDYVRTTAPSPLVRPRTVLDTLVGWRNEPNANRADVWGKGIALHTDAHGFRATAATPAAGPTTIVCSGDSYAFGVGVADEDTWCARLQQTLNGARTVNFGQDGYGVDQSFLLYQREAAAVPHAIHLFALTNPALERATSSDDAGWPRPLLSLMDGRLTRQNVPVPAPSAREYTSAARGRKVADLRVMQLVRRLTGSDPNAERSARVEQMRPAFQRMLAELQTTDRAVGTKLIAVYLPTAADTRGLDDRRAWLADAAKQLGIGFVDLTPGVRAMRKDSLDALYFARWSPVQPAGAIGQYSKVGHAWVARTLAEQLGPMLSMTPEATNVIRR